MVCTKRVNWKRSRSLTSNSAMLHVVDWATTDISNSAMLHVVDWATTDILKSVVLQLQSQTNPSSKFRHLCTTWHRVSSRKTWIHFVCDNLKSRERGADRLHSRRHWWIKKKCGTVLWYHSLGWPLAPCMKSQGGHFENLNFLFNFFIVID
jgi:hypothetical protein